MQYVDLQDFDKCNASLALPPMFKKTSGKTGTALTICAENCKCHAPKFLTDDKYTPKEEEPKWLPEYVASAVGGKFQMFRD